MFIKFSKSSVGSRGIPANSILVRKSGIYLGKKDTESDYYCIEVDRDTNSIRLSPSSKGETGAYKMTNQDGTKYFAIPRFSGYMPIGRYIKNGSGVYVLERGVE